MAREKLNPTAALASTVLVMVAILAAPAMFSFLRDRPANNLLIIALQNEETLYSNSFSERSFQRVEPGMTEPQVTRSLGRPLKIVETTNGRLKRVVVYDGAAEKILYPDLPSTTQAKTEEAIYYYSQPKTPSSDWHVRAITFTPEGIVKKVTKEFYVD